MSRRHHRGAPVVGPVILIGAGVVFLLNNMGVLPWSVWNQLWRLWPLILIAIGLDILVGRRSALLSTFIVLLLVGGGVAFLIYTSGFQSGGTLVQTNINATLSGAKEASVSLELGTGNLTLDTSANSESLATGTLEYYQNRDAPEQSLSTANGRAMLTLRQREGSGFGLGFMFGSNPTPQWNVHLNPNVIMTFNADLGTGNSTIDLSNSKATTVGINSGTGNSTIFFPGKAGQVTGKIDGGVGNLSLKITDGLHVRLDMNKGIGNLHVDDRFTKQGDNIYLTSGYNNSSVKNKLDLKVDAGIGNIEVSR